MRRICALGNWKPLSIDLYFGGCGFALVTQGIEVAEDVMRIIHKVNLRFSAQAV